MPRKKQASIERDFGATPFSYFRRIAYRFGDTPEHMQAVLEGTGVAVGDLDDGRVEFNLAQQLRQFENLNRLVGPGWVLHALKLFSPTSHDNLGLAVINAPTVRAGLLIIRDYVQRRVTRIRAHLTEAPEGATLAFDVGSGLTLEQSRPFAEILLLSALSIIETQLPATPDKIRLFFECPEPAHSPALRAAVGDRFVYDAPATAIFVPTEYLDVRPLLADSSLHAIAVERLEQDARRSRSAEGIRARVERLLAGSPTGRLDAGLIAASLGVSTRSLTRKLAEARTDVRDLTDAELHRRADRYIAAGHFSMAEISERLGYADPTGFSRAVRRWKLRVRKGPVNALSP